MNTDRIIQALNAGIENTQELLDQHDQALGRTTPRNKRWAEQLEEDIKEMQLATVDVGNHKPEGSNIYLECGKTLTPNEALDAMYKASFIILAVGTSAANNCRRLAAARAWMQDYFPNRI